MSSASAVDTATLHLHLYCLGWPQLWCDDRHLDDFSSSKALALLIFLAHHEGAQPRAKLIDLLWSEATDKKAQSSLRSTLYYISQQLGDVLAVTRRSIGYAPHVLVRTDTAPLLSEEWSVSQALPEDLEERFLASFHVKDAPLFDLWLSETRNKLNEKIVARLLMSLKAHEGAFRVEESLVAAQKILQCEPWNESAYRGAMLAHARRGEYAVALRLFRDCEVQLEQEVGGFPSSQTRALVAQIQAASQSRAVSSPRPKQALLGREQDMTRLQVLVCAPESDLIVISGLGGVGKTSLAMALRSWCQERFLHGALWISLKSIEHVDALPATILQTLGVPVSDHDRAREELLSHCQDWETIFFLDNADHLLSDPTQCEVIVSILEQIPRAKCVVTSRIKVQHKACVQLPLQGLSTTSSGPDLSALSAAEAFLVQRVKRMLHNYDPIPDRELLHALCTKLQGLPLGLEVVAPLFAEPHTKATLYAWSMEEGEALAPLWSTVEHRRVLDSLFLRSLCPLSDTTQRAFDAFALFVGGSSPESGAAVLACDETIFLRLCRHSLLQRNGERYDMHPMLREFAQYRLAERDDADALRRQFYTHYLNALKKHYRDPFTRQEALHRIAEEELPNLRLAWSLAVAQEDWVVLAEALAPLYKFLEESGRLREGGTWFQRTLEQDPERAMPSSLRAHLLGCCARLFSVAGAVERSASLIEEAMSLDGSYEAPEIAYFVWNIKGAIEIRQADFASAETSFLRALSLAQAELAAPWQVRPLVNLGSACLRSGQLQKAREILQQGRVLCEEHELFHGLAHILNNLGVVLLIERKYQAAHEVFLQCVGVSADLGYAYVEASSMENLSEVAYFLGEHEKSLALAQEAAEKWEALDNPSGLLRASYGQILPLLALGQKEASVRCCLDSFVLAEKNEARPARNGLFCRIAEALLGHGDPKTAAVLSHYLLKQPETETQYHKALQEICALDLSVQEGTESAALYPSTDQAWLIRLHSLFRALAHMPPSSPSYE